MGHTTSGEYAVKAFDNVVSDCGRSFWFFFSNYTPEPYETAAYTRNNISLNPKKYHTFISNSTNLDLSLDENIYYPDGAGLFYAPFIGTGDFASWQAFTGQDLGSTTEKPNLRRTLS